MKQCVVITTCFLLVFVFASESYGCRLFHARHFRLRGSVSCCYPRPCPPKPPAPYIPPEQDIDTGSLTNPIIDGNQISWNAAYAMGCVSNLIYSQQSIVEKQLMEWGFQCRYVKKWNAAACVAWNEEVAIIAFCGTNDLADFIVDITADYIWLPEGLMHLGFYSQYKLLEPSVLAALPPDNARRKLWITGHSLGGALATICEYSFAKKGIRIDNIVTFGQPMLAGRAMSWYLGNRLKGRYVRFVNERDLIPCIPPWFQHFGKQAWFWDDEVDIRALMKGKNDESVLLTNEKFAPNQRQLSQREFDQLKRVVRANRGILNERYGAMVPKSYGEADGKFPDLYIPRLRDHGMIHYLEKLVSRIGKD